ncbi:prepilin peptidase [Mycolicibacterium pulveris]|uniref:prepilin peptidase n=1 Tax=Mycolicibacterium pulveris TaxID=36813 RepID=UPI003CF73BF7
MGAAACAAVLVWLAALCVFDITERRLPNWLTVPGATVILVGAAVAGHGVPAALGAVALFAIYLVVHLLAPTAMGAGDVKLAAGVGALTGAFGVDVWMLSALAAPLLTAGLAIGALVRRGESAVPHGPSMCLAAAAAVSLAVL